MPRIPTFPADAPLYAARGWGGGLGAKSWAAPRPPHMDRERRRIDSPAYNHTTGRLMAPIPPGSRRAPPRGAGGGPTRGPVVAGTPQDEGAPRERNDADGYRERGGIPRYAPMPAGHEPVSGGGEGPTEPGRGGR